MWLLRKKFHFGKSVRLLDDVREGTLIDDFLFKESPRSLHVCNAPSPAATSCLPTADEIVSRALRKAN